jgi:hypothetical protein
MRKLQHESCVHWMEHKSGVQRMCRLRLFWETQGGYFRWILYLCATHDCLRTHASKITKDDVRQILSPYSAIPRSLTAEFNVYFTGFMWDMCNYRHV